MSLATVSYGSAVAAHVLLIALLLASRDRGHRGHWLLAAAAGTLAWASVISFDVAAWGPGPSRLSYAADVVRSLVLILCLLAALPREGAWRRTKLLVFAGAGSLTVIALVALLTASRPASLHFALIGVSIIGCLAVEQIFRNSTSEQQRVLSPFVWTAASIFGYDLFVFSEATLFGVADTNLWGIRGFFAAAAVPPLVLSAKRQPDWSKLFISRHVVFYSATLSAVGLYLVAMALGAALIRREGGEWGVLAQVTFFTAALVMLAFILSSAGLRTQVRVFISKHFYRNRYEYRDEWLRLIRTLSGTDLELPLEQRGIKALAEIVNSPGGQLWLDTRGAAVYEPFAAWGAPFPTTEYAGASALVRFLSNQQWIIDSEEYARDPERYGHAFAADPAALPGASLIIPLIGQKDLFGFVSLLRPLSMRPLNYEDHDLLKTAGRQVAAFLAHDLATEQLAETRQFEAFNKLSAFVVHDLKNLLAQQVLLVENAKKHQHRPEFVADVVRTVDHGVQRMRRLLRQVEQRSVESQDQRVELNGLVERAIAACSANDKASLEFHAHSPVWVHAHPDRLCSVITHVIVNAQQAVARGGLVAVRVTGRDGKAVVEVQDEGEGMTEEFIRRRLFKPFDTTKGSSGMGIGAYQAREFVRALGGEIGVVSTVGEGTTVTISLPLASKLFSASGMENEASAL